MNAINNQALIKQQIIEIFTDAGIEFAGDAETNVYPTPRMSGWWTAEVLADVRAARKVLEDAGITDIRGLTEQIAGREVAIMRFVPIARITVTEFSVKHLSTGVVETTVFPAPDEAAVSMQQTEAPDTAISLPASEATVKYAQAAHDLIKDLSAETAQQVVAALRAVVNIAQGGQQLIYSNGKITVISTADYNLSNVELSKAQQKVGRLSIDVERLKAELTTEKNRIIDPGEYSAMQKQITQLQNDLQILKGRPTQKELADANMALMEAKNQIVALTSERDELSTKLSQLETESPAVSAAEQFIYSLNTPLVTDVELAVYDTAKSEQVRSANRQIADGLNSGKRIAYEQFDFVTGKHLVRWEFDHQESAQLPLNAAVLETVVPDEVVAASSAPHRPSPFEIPVITQSPLNAIVPTPAPAGVRVPTAKELSDAFFNRQITSEQYTRLAAAAIRYPLTKKYPTVQGE